MNNDGFVVYISDVESTGLDPVENEIVELSMIRLLPQEDGGYKEEQKTWLLRAMNPKTIQDEALRINGHKREDILCLSKYGKENYRNPAEVVEEVDLWIMEDNVSAMDRIFGGQNPTFDEKFIRKLYERNGRPNEEDFPFATGNGNRIIDTKQMMLLFDICTGRRRKFYNLGAFVKALGIKKHKLHRADEDTRVTKDVLLTLVSMIKDTVAEKFKDCYPED